MRHSPDPGGPIVRRMLVGAQLRRLREARKITRGEAAGAIRGSESKISRLELGRLSFRERDLEDLLTLYGVRRTAERESLLALARDANTPRWWQPYDDVLPPWLETFIGLESDASQIRTYESFFVPGLLQAEEYARTVLGMVQAGHRPPPSAEEVELKVGLRTKRQQILLRTGSTTRLVAVISELALRHVVGEDVVMEKQLRHLLELQEHPRVTIHVVPFRMGRTAGELVPFTILGFAGSDLADVVYVEHLSGAVYLDKPEDVDPYTVAFDQLLGEAAPDPSVMITELLDDY